MVLMPERRMEEGVDAEDAKENKAPRVVEPIPMLPPEFKTNFAPV